MPREFQTEGARKLYVLITADVDSDVVVFVVVVF